MEHAVKQLMHQWKGSFYVEPLLICTALVCFILIFKQPRPYPRILFLVYIGSLFSLFIFVDVLYCINAPWIFRLRGWEIIDTLFEFIQAYVFIKFYSSQILDHKYIELANFILFVLFIFVIFNIIYISESENDEIYSFKSVSTTIFLFGLAVPPIYHFYYLLKNDKSLEPTLAFLSITIVAYCMISAITFGIIDSFRKTSYEMVYVSAVALHYLLLILLCIILVNYQKQEGSHNAIFSGN
jgi:hypothetical protein